MKWWKRALIVWIVFTVLVIGVGFYITNIYMAGKITDKQEDAIGEVCGEVVGVGTVLIWVVSFVSRSK